jgi:hypothetical protein
LAGTDTWLCLALNLPVDPGRSRKWLKWFSPGWLSRPIGFNGGARLRDDDVRRVVERLQRLGDVHEVQIQGGSLNGLRLFYIGKVPRSELGSNRGNRTLKSYPVSAGASGSLASEQP